MPVDTSFYNTQPPPNIYAGLGSTVGLANGIVENRMLQNELQSRQAIGNAYQQSLNPDGTINVPQLDRSIAANPAAAYGAAQGYANSASLQGANLANQGAAVQQAQGRMNDFYNSIGALPPEQRTYSNVMGVAANMLHQGRLLQPDVAAINAEVPLDNSGVQNYVQKKFTSALSPGQQAAQGPQIVDPQTGATYTPTEAQFLQRATSPNSPGVQSGLASGQGSSIADNTSAFNDALDSSSKILLNNRNLATAIPLLEKLPSSAGGPGAEIRAQLKSFLITNVPGFNPASDDPVVLRAETQKYLQRNIDNTPNAARSDMAQQLTTHASPNLDTPLAATLALAKSNLAFNRMEAAIPRAYQLAHPEATLNFAPGFKDFRTKYLADTDPRAFGFDRFSPSERQGIVSTLGKPGSPSYEKFRISLESARDTQSIDPPGAQ